MTVVSAMKMKGGEAGIRYYLDYLRRAAERDAHGVVRVPGARWVGAAAVDLGLAGAEFRPEDFKRLALGQAPDGTPLVRQGKNRCPGWDFTFSAEKSVSLAYALAEDELRIAIRQAFDRATDEALRWLEAEGGAARRGHAGRDGHVGAGIAAAVFNHNDSREGDPQLHCHAVITNIAHGSDDRWSSLDSRSLYALKRTASSVHAAHLRTEMAALGLEFAPPDEHGNAELEGIPDRLIRRFSKRRIQIEARVQSRGIAPTREARQMANLDTRKGKEQDVDPAEQREHWRAEAAELLFGPDEIEALRHPISLDPPTRAQRRELIEGVLTELTTMRAAFSKADLVFKLSRQLPLGTPPDEIPALADEALELADVHELTGVDAVADPVLRARRMWTTTAVRAMESEVIAAAVDSTPVAGAAVAPEVVNAAIASEPALSDEQAAMVRAITSDRRVSVVVGPPGSGKSSALRVANAAWQAAGRPVFGAAVAGLAEQDLGRGTGMSTSTIALLRTWLDGGAGLPMRVVLVLDESSMISTPDLARLLRAVTDADGQLVLVGDTRQLPSIEVGGLFNTIATDQRAKVIELSENHRQREEWAQAAVRALREGRAADAWRAYEAHGQVTLSDDEADLARSLIADWWAARAEGHETAILSLRRADTALLNAAAHQLLRDSGQLAGPELVVPEHVASGGRELPERVFQVGDEVRCLSTGKYQRYRARGIRNGTVGTVVGVAEEGAVTVLPNGTSTPVTLDAEYVEAHLNWAYASTVHGAQGRTVGSSAGGGDVFVWAGAELDARAAHVALSRATDATRIYSLTEVGGVDDDEEFAMAAAPGNPAAVEALRRWSAARAPLSASDTEARRDRVRALVASTPRMEMVADFRRLGDIVVAADLDVDAEIERTQARIAAWRSRQADTNDPELEQPEWTDEQGQQLLPIDDDLLIDSLAPALLAPGGIPTKDVSTAALAALAEALEGEQPTPPLSPIEPPDPSPWSARMAALQRVQALREAGRTVDRGETFEQLAELGDALDIERRQRVATAIITNRPWVEALAGPAPDDRDRAAVERWRQRVGVAEDLLTSVVEARQGSESPQVRAAADRDAVLAVVAPAIVASDQRGIEDFADGDQLDRLASPLGDHDSAAARRQLVVLSRLAGDDVAEVEAKRVARVCRRTDAGPGLAAALLRRQAQAVVERATADGIEVPSALRLAVEPGIGFADTARVAELVAARQEEAEREALAEAEDDSERGAQRRRWIAGRSRQERAVELAERRNERGVEL